MSDKAVMEAFLQAAEDWVCDDCSLDIRFVAEVNKGRLDIWSASVHVNPLPATIDVNMYIETTRFVAGQVQVQSSSKADLLTCLRQAASGQILLTGRPAIGLPADAELDFYSENAVRDKWASMLHLQVFGLRRSVPSVLDLAKIDNEFRSADPPFDGLTDVTAWLGLSMPGASAPSISIYVGPPVDLIYNESSFVDKALHLTLHAHSRFETDRVRLAIRGLPGLGLTTRQQVASDIRWSDGNAQRRIGTLDIQLGKSDSALTMLTLGGAIVRRQWFSDPAKARNVRMLATQHFDADLRMIRTALFDAPESARFENGIAATLYLLGFNPAVQLEKDAPDLLVTTPGGRLAIVECTTRVADIAAKVGKLVDRRGSLSKALAGSGHPAEVSAVLVCRLPLDQLTAQVQTLRRDDVLLITREDIEAALHLVRNVNDADAILARALASTPGSVFESNAGS